MLVPVSRFEIGLNSNSQIISFAITAFGFVFAFGFMAQQPLYDS